MKENGSIQEEYLQDSKYAHPQPKKNGRIYQKTHNPEIDTIKKLRRSPSPRERYHQSHPTVGYRRPRRPRNGGSSSSSYYSTSIDKEFRGRSRRRRNESESSSNDEVGSLRRRRRREVESDRRYRMNGDGGLFENHRKAVYDKTFRMEERREYPQSPIHHSNSKRRRPSISPFRYNSSERAPLPSRKYYRNRVSRSRSPSQGTKPSYRSPLNRGPSHLHSSRNYPSRRKQAPFTTYHRGGRPIRTWEHGSFPHGVDQLDEADYKLMKGHEGVHGKYLNGWRESRVRHSREMSRRYGDYYSPRNSNSSHASSGRSEYTERGYSPYSNRVPPHSMKGIHRDIEYDRIENHRNRKRIGGMSDDEGGGGYGVERKGGMQGDRHRMETGVRRTAAYSGETMCVDKKYVMRSHDIPGRRSRSISSEKRRYITKSQERRRKRFLNMFPNDMAFVTNKKEDEEGDVNNKIKNSNDVLKSIKSEHTKMDVSDGTIGVIVEPELNVGSTTTADTMQVSKLSETDKLIDGVTQQGSVRTPPVLLISNEEKNDRGDEACVSPKVNGDVGIIHQIINAEKMHSTAEVKQSSVKKSLDSINEKTPDAAADEMDASSSSYEEGIPITGLFNTEAAELVLRLIEKTESKYESMDMRGITKNNLKYRFYEDPKGIKVLIEDPHFGRKSTVVLPINSTMYCDTCCDHKERMACDVSPNPCFYSSRNTPKLKRYENHAEFMELIESRRVTSSRWKASCQDLCVQELPFQMLLAENMIVETQLNDVSATINSLLQEKK